MQPVRSQATTTGIARLVITQPFFASLLLDLMRIEEVPEDHPVIDTAATNGRTIWVNAGWFAKLDLEHRVFVLAHEVGHAIFDHALRSMQFHQTGIGPAGLPWSADLANIVQDAIINDWLITSHVGVMPSVGVHDTSIATHNDMWEEVYARLFKEGRAKVVSPKGGKGKEEGDGDGEGMPGVTLAKAPQQPGFDQHNFGEPCPDKDGEDGDGPAPGEGPISKTEMEHALINALSVAKAMGAVPANMERFVGQLLEPQVNWAEELVAAVAKAGGRDMGTWSRPNRRRLALAPHVYLPGKTGVACGPMAIYADSSGSVGGAEWRDFMSEMAGIVESMNPEETYIGCCSTQASVPILIESSEDVASYVATEGGGTDMGAIFPTLAEHGVHPDVCVILTDGYTPWGEKPPYEVIWVITTAGISAPYGRSIHIKVRGGSHA